MTPKRGIALALAVASWVTPLYAADPQTTSDSAKLKSRLQQSGAPPGAPAASGVLFSADQVIDDRDRNLITAKGHVEVSQGERVVLADQLVYDTVRDTITASGHVSITEPTGEVLLSDHLVLSRDLKEATARNIRLLLGDLTRLGAVGAVRHGAVTVYSKGVYTGCKACDTDPGRPLVWQVKAVRIVHDSESHDLTYHDAWIELLDIPVFFTPYLSTPDPSVRERSGVLFPTIIPNNETTGPGVSLPYLYQISPSADITVTPTFMRKDGLLLGLDYRERFGNGRVRIQASGIRERKYDPTGNQFSLISKLGDRGYFHATGEYDLDETWRVGLDAARASDNFYLARYRIAIPYNTTTGSSSDNNTLVSNAYLEGFRGSDYAAANLYEFQDLATTSDRHLSPLVFPYLQYSHVGDVNSFGAYTTLDANVMNFDRKRGSTERRLSFLGGWHLPHIFEDGETLKVTGTIQADGVWSRHVFNPNLSQPLLHGEAGRFFPQLAVEWRYPLVSTGESISQILEPIVQLVAAPYGSNPQLIPNEDSRYLDLTDTNLFALNRFYGSDRVDSGPRLTYGIDWTTAGLDGMGTEVLVGQSVQPHRNALMPPGSGLDKSLSDYTGRVRISPSSYLNLVYRFRFDANSFAPKREEVGLTTGPAAFRLGLTYLALDRAFDRARYPERDELTPSFSTQLTRYWRIQGYLTRRFETPAQWINSGAAITYEDECFRVSLNTARYYNYNRNIGNNTAVVLQFVFKSLGEVHMDSAP